ncbi:MAG: DUF1772 domain-containing protein [Actinomycetota bacterium]|nr:DUF1772 domain-containing protein [Actinomycetota bacterium]
MLIKSWRFITLVLAALLVGTTFCHLLELPAKIQYPASLYLTLHRTLYVAFGPPGPGPFIEIGAILAAAVLVFLVRRRRPAVWLTLIGAVSLAAGLGVYFAFVEPANVAMKRMIIDAPPADWTRWREQWEYGHAARFVFDLIGFSALALSVILEASTARTTERASASVSPP